MERKRKIYLIIKRLLDIILSLIGILLLIPTAIIIKICYCIGGDFHSIFYSQKRIGKNGKEFNFYKFRSMVVNADEQLDLILQGNEDLRKEFAINKKLKHDPRVTKVGTVIRKISVDELPNFINVLKGDLSIVGNRPYLPREKKDMGAYFDKIVSLKPGVTGLWQVSGEDFVDFESRLQIESYYCDHFSFWMDFKIFFQTFRVTLFGRAKKRIKKQELEHTINN